MQALPGAEKGRWTPRLHVDRSGLERAGDLRNRELQPSVQRVFQERDVAALHLHGPDSELPPFHAPNGIFRTIDNIRRGNNPARYRDREAKSQRGQTHLHLKFAPQLTIVYNLPNPTDLRKIKCGAVLVAKPVELVSLRAIRYNRACRHEEG